jgi:cytochrome c553
MKTTIAVAILFGAAAVAAGTALRAQQAPPAWAYAVGNAAPGGGRGAGRGAAAADAAHRTTPRSLPGASKQFTIEEVEAATPADWFPEDHPPMPSIVASGRPPAIRACAYCHMPNGKGRPSNAPVAGLPTAYFIETLNDFRNDLRKTGEPRKTNTNQMIAIAKAMTPEEMQAAAEYFGSMKWTPWIRVVEAEMVPKTRVEGSIHWRLEGNEMEPLGMRIVEMPENTEETEELRNPRSGMVAYAPVGSIAKGEALVKTGGGGKTLACGACHGAALQGAGKVPGIAGRSPSYLARQMYDIQAGTRQGLSSKLMKPVVAKLTEEDYVNITAYVASLKP